MKKLMFALIAALTAAFSALTLCGCNIIDSNLPAIFSANDIYGSVENSGGSGGSSGGGSSSSGKMTEQQWNTAINNTMLSDYCQVNVSSFINGETSIKHVLQFDLKQEVAVWTIYYPFDTNFGDGIDLGYADHIDQGYLYFAKNGDNYEFNLFSGIYTTWATFPVKTKEIVAACLYCQIIDNIKSIEEVTLNMNYDILGDMGFSFLKDPSEKINTLIPDYSEVEYDSATGSYKCSKEEPFDGSPEFPYLTGTANYNYTTEFKDDKLYKIKNKHNVFLKSNLDSIEQNVFIEGNVDFSYEQKPVEIPEEIRQKMV